MALAIGALAGSGCSVLNPGQRSHYTLNQTLAVEDPAFVRSLDNFGCVWEHRAASARFAETFSRMFQPLY
jgi:hypothetical protein